MNKYLRQNWERSKLFRGIVIIILIYALARIAVHGVFLSEVLKSGDLEGHDLQVYLDAATRLTQHQNLYPQGEISDWIEFYQYAPAYALAFTPFLKLPIGVVMGILSLLHLAAYIVLYWRWDRIFTQIGLNHAREMLAWTLPIWVVFSQFWADLGYLNIYIFLALASTLLIEAILNERLGLAILWLSLILQAKPQWAFPLALPLLLGQWRFFLKLLVGAILVYGAILGASMLIAGPSYIWQQQLDYIRLLSSISSGNYPWRAPTEPFLGYNHSIAQIVVYLFGVTPGNLQLATGIQILLLLPLAIIGLRYMFQTLQHSQYIEVRKKLEIAFALYLGAFIWLDVVWEVTFSIVLFTYLAATLKGTFAKTLMWGVFMAYALLDFWQLASFIIFGEEVILPGLYIATDPSIYVPLTMIVILTFYALLIKRLWSESSYQAKKGIKA